MRDDGDPFDLPDPEDDEESGEDDWYDEEGDDDENDANVRTYAASDCERTITERRTREQDTVKVPAFPTLPSLTQWRIQIAKNLVTASGRLDLRWGVIGLAENNFETLAHWPTPESAHSWVLTSSCRPPWVLCLSKQIVPLLRM